MNGVKKSLLFLYSNGGPNAPIEWIMDNIDYLTNSQNRHQLLIGINMYAMSYLQTRAPEPLVMKTVVEKLTDQPKELYDELLDNADELISDDEELNWDKEFQEAWFIDIDEDGTRQGTVWMPTYRVNNILFSILLSSINIIHISLFEIVFVLPRITVV
jgi:chitinase domain-containing protein 1